MYFIKLKKISRSSLKFNQRGFGLIELLVSISIIAMVSSVVLVRNNAFNGAVLLRDQAYEVAFALKQAQLMAVSGTDVAGAKSQTFGIYFERGTTKNQQYLTFRDDGVNIGRYDPSSDVQVGLLGHLDKRFQIREFTKADGTVLGKAGLSVTFTRPNFDAEFMSGDGTIFTENVYIQIAQTSKDNTDNNLGSVRCVKVTPTGQISVVVCPTP